jgi:hypothetical protein
MRTGWKECEEASGGGGGPQVGRVTASTVGDSRKLICQIIKLLYFRLYWCRYKAQIVDEVAWAKNRTKSKVRAKVEHVFQVLKLRFGFVKVRYRGLKKNAHRLFVTSALVNLFVSRKKLLLARV